MAHASEIPHVAAVGNSFVKQYYHLLATSPQTLHRFYKETSQFTHGVGSQKEEPISGQANIDQKISSIGFAGAHVDLESGSIDFQPSLDGGLIVMVVGEITLKGQAPRAFVQTFFLARQPTGFYVLNDAFRFIDGIPKKQAQLTPPGELSSQGVKALPVEVPTAQSPARPPTQKQNRQVAPPAPEPQNVKPKASPEQAQPATPEQSGNQVPQKAATVATPAPAKAQQQPAGGEKQEAAKATSWAALVSQAQPRQSTPAPAPKKPQHQAQAQAQAQTPPTESVAAPEPAQGTSGNGAAQRQNGSKGLFVRNVPAGTKEEDLIELFKEFGTVTSVKITQKGAVFVDFEKEESAAKALSKKEFTIKGKVIAVEERLPRADRAPRGEGGRGRGRGRGPRGGRGDRGDRDSRGDNNGRRDRSRRSAREDNREKSGRQGAWMNVDKRGVSEETSA